MRERNYHRLLDLHHIDDSGEFERDNIEDLRARILECNDIYERDKMYIALSSTNSYANNLAKEKWKECLKRSNKQEDDSEEFNSAFDDLIFLDLEESIIKYKENEKMMKVIIFFLLINRVYRHLSFSFRETFKSYQIEIQSKILKFQRAKTGMERVSSIERSSQKFIIENLNCTKHEASSLIRKTKDIINNILHEDL